MSKPTKEEISPTRKVIDNEGKEAVVDFQTYCALKQSYEEGNWSVLIHDVSDKPHMIPLEENFRSSKQEVV